MTERKCPHCGAPLAEDASFCPHCARDVHRRKPAGKGVLLRKKLLLTLAVLVALGAVGGTIWWFNRPYVPQEYDSGDTGQVIYTVDGVDYQLVVAWANSFTEPAPYISQSGRADEMTRWPSRFYVNHTESGEDAWPEFQAYVASVAVEVEQDPTGTSELVAGEPLHRDDYDPRAALISTLDFTGDCGSPQVVWTVTMTNGDVVRVRQTIDVALINTLVYDWRDYPMETMEELQALLDEIDQSVNWQDEVVIYLPPVTYEGELYLNGISHTMYGCDDGTGRTVFTGTVHVNTQNAYWLNFFEDIDFVGDGSGTALSFEKSGRATNCTFTGWDTAVVALNESWVNVIGCTLEHNNVAFHYNSDGQSANHSMYNDNVFRNNGTAVLLDSVPTDIALDFQGTLFENNGTDIDNRCGHPVDDSQAVFQ